MLSYQTPFDAFFSPVRYQQRQNLHRTRQASQPTFEDLLLNLFNDNQSTTDQNDSYDYDYNRLNCKYSPRNKQPSNLKKNRHPFTRSRTFMPAIDAYDNQSSYLIKLNLQGATINDIDLEYDSKLRSLTISGLIPRLGNFSKTIKFPENMKINENKITAQFKNDGILNIEVPKKSIYGGRKRHIPVESDVKVERSKGNESSNIDNSNDGYNFNESEINKDVSSENDAEEDDWNPDLFQDALPIIAQGQMDLEKPSTNIKSKKLIIQPTLEEVEDEEFSDLSSNF